MQVSVIIPTYNRAATILRAVRSVQAQTYQDYELVIVDDGSLDDTAEILASLNEPRLRLIRHTTNSGSARARNTGVSEARGDFIAFLDSDDEWLPEKLAHQMEVVHKQPGGITANVSGFYLYDDANIRRTQVPGQPGSWHRHLLMGCGLGEGTTLLVARQAFDQVGDFDTCLRRYADWDWLLRYTRLYPLTVTPEPLAVVYRASAPRAQVVEGAAVQFLEKHQAEFKEAGWYGRRAVGKRYLEVAIYYFVEKNRKEGLKWLRKALNQSVFQRPSMYLRILDALLGTSLVSSMIRARERF
jgi:glycosyltransferase involved in cell wall biosynthesis